MQIPTRPLYQLFMAVILFLAACAGAQAQTGDTRINDLQKQALEAYDRFDYSKALPLLEEVQAYLEKNAGPQEQNSIEIMCALTHVYAFTGHFAEAVELGEKARSLCEQYLGDSESTYGVMMNLVMAYSGLGQFDRSIALLEKNMLSLAERLYGPKDSHYWDIQMLRAMTYAKKDDTLRAKELFDAYLPAMIEERGLASLLGVRAEITFASVQATLGDYEAAIKTLTEIQPVCEVLQGVDEPYCVVGRQWLALIHQARGETEKARLASEPTPEYLFYTANKEEFERQRQKAARLRQEEDFKGAAAILEKVYETLESEKLLFSEQGMAVFIELNQAYDELDDLQYRLKTRVLADMGIKVSRRYYGAKDPRTIAFAMIGVYNDNELNDPAAAEALGREWLPYCLAVFGPKHLATLRFKLYLAAARAARGQKAEAQALIREVESAWAGKEDKSSEEDKLFAYELRQYRRACR